MSELVLYTSEYGELNPEATVNESLTVQTEGNRGIQRAIQIGPGVKFGLPEPKTRLESRLESNLAMKVFLLLSKEPLGKASIAPLLGHKTISGELHKQIKRMVGMGLIEPTIPEKPTSRLQKYRLTERGNEVLGQLKKRGGGE